MGIPGRPEMLAAADYTDSEQGAQEIVEALKKAVFRGRIRMNQFFEDFDPLRAGVISSPKFRTALVASGAMPLTEKQMQLLTVHFIDPTDTQRVRYVELLKELETVFTTSNMQYDPHSTGTDFTPALIKEGPVLGHSIEAAADEVIARLSHLVKTRGLLPRQPFDDYCKNPNSPIQVDEVTFMQFRNGLSRLGLEVSGSEAEVLKLRFPGSADGYVNYVAFCCAIDEAERTFSTRMPQADLLASNTLHGGFRKPRTVRGGEQPGRMPNVADQPKLVTESAQAPDALELQHVITALQDKALQHRLRVSDFLRDADKHHDGTITVPQFVAALNLAFDKMHVGLSEKEVELLVAHYKKPMVHGATHVLWRKFAEDIEAVFTRFGLEKEPTATPSVRLLQHNVVTLPDAAREGAVQKLLAELRQRVLVRRVLVKPMFSDYEQQVNSAKVIDHITRQQMLQALSRFGVELDHRQAELLFERYDTLGDGTVNYVALVRDVDPYENFSQRQTSHHVFPQDPQYTGKIGIPPGGFWKSRTVDGLLLNMQPGRPPTMNDLPRNIKAPPQQSAEQIVKRLQAAALRTRVRVEDSFKDFDRHRCGSITVPQFTIAMQMTFGRSEPLSQSEFETLVAAYAIERPGCVHVRWKNLVDDINHGDNPMLLHRTPTATLQAHVVPSKSLVPLTAAEEAQLEGVMARFRHFTFTRRMLVKPYFADAERNRRSMRVVDHVTRPQFEACLARLGLEASNEELELLHRKFNDNGDGYANYVAFTRAIDADETSSDRTPEGRGGAARQIATNGGFKAVRTLPTQPGRAPPQMDFPRLNAEQQGQPLPQLMARLQNKCIQYGMNGPHQFFSDYDRHTQGTVTIPQFRAALYSAFGASYMKADLTEKECQLLEERYAALRIDGDTHVYWKKFCNDLAAAAVPAHLEYAPHAEVPQTLIERQERQLSAEEEARLAPLLEKMRKRFHVRCVYVKGPFHDFALSKNSPKMIDHVTRQQFVQGLSRLGLEPSPDEFALLFKKFDDDGVGNVNYVAFARAVDALETFSDRSNASALARNTLHGGFRKPKVPLDFLASSIASIK